MDGLLTAIPLRGAQVRRAYTLVELMHPQVTAAQWATFVRRYARVPRHRGGLMGIQDGRGYLHAVFCYTVDWSPLAAGRVLQVQEIILAQLPGRTLEAALTACAEHLAAEFECEGIIVDIPVRAPEAPCTGSTQATLQSAGFHVARVKMVRPHRTATRSSGAGESHLSEGSAS